jgi:hypothetical protein
VDYAEAGRALLARVNLPADGDGVPKVERYSNYNALWRHPTTGGTLYVGNASTAASRPMLEDMKCSNIVFCQESDGRMHFRDDPSFTYLPFPIGAWRRTLASTPNADATWAYFKPLFDFVDSKLGAGESVLIHCLAGAHRAGTAGTACLMHLCAIDSRTAVPMAKKLRPAIDPIGSFPDLLARLDAAFAKHRP